jgi:betaine-aldehyde dehydrogenase
MTNDLAQDRLWRLLIDGRLVRSADGRTLPVTNPATGQLVGTVPCGGRADVDSAVEAARKAFPGWRHHGPSRRASVVGDIADVIETHSEEFAALDTLDTGVPLTAMRRDVELTVEQMRYFAGLALHIRGETIPTDGPDSIDFTVREPFGVVARISPFNHPLLLAAAKVAAPLIAGNTVILKPSEHTPLSALRLGELVAGVVPPGVLNIVTGFGHEAGDRIARHPGVPRISFTGGAVAGRAIQAAGASAAVKNVSLELGGKNPLIVCSDADVDEAADGALRGMNFAWQGQSCGSTSRVYAHASLIDEFVIRLGHRMKSLIVGDPFDACTQVGALSSRAQFDKVSSYLERAHDDPRARIVAGGRDRSDVPEEGFFVTPTLVVLDDDSSALAREEIFGPIVVVIPFDDIDPVIRACNDSEYGLTAGVYSRSLTTALSVARGIESGYVWVNWTSTHVPGTPFGGVKNSGNSREDELQELLSYTQLKNVFINFSPHVTEPPLLAADETQD